MAVARFPAFCGEVGVVNGFEQTKETLCKRELAALFAFISVESGQIKSLDDNYERTSPDSAEAVDLFTTGFSILNDPNCNAEFD